MRGPAGSGWQFVVVGAVGLGTLFSALGVGWWGLGGLFVLYLVLVAGVRVIDRR
jgi:hypothetical protein